MRDLASISGLTEAEFVGLSKRAQAGVPVPPGFFTASCHEVRQKPLPLIRARRITAAAAFAGLGAESPV